MAEQAGRLAYAHGSAFTTEPLEAYAARRRRRHLPSTTRRSTRCRVARRRSRPRSSWPAPITWRAARPTAGSSSGAGGAITATRLGALDLSGPPPLRRPYEAWLGRFRHVSAAYPYRADDPGRERPRRRRRARRRARPRFEPPVPGTVAAFVAEPIVGATLAAAVPPDGYWPAIAEVCRRHGVLLIADEVMTGFGRTGRWFGLDHWGVRPDILVAAKGATSGYWPFGFVAASGRIHDDGHAAAGPFVHGFTYSHAPVGAAVAREVLRILETRRWSRRARRRASGCGRCSHGRVSAEHPAVGEIRGRGLLVGIELVADRETARPFPRAARVTEPSCAAARERGVLVYSGTGNANGVDGDTILLGPPFVVTDAELERIVDVLADSIEARPRSPTPPRASGPGRAHRAGRAAGRARPARSARCSRRTTRPRCSRRRAGPGSPRTRVASRPRRPRTPGPRR